MQSTIKDVAKKASVSIATVSLVLHNNKRISSATRDRVLKAIKKLDYHPSRSARGLVSKKTGMIGFILTDDHFLRTEPFYTRVFLGTEFEARNHEYYVLLTTISASTNNGESFPRFVLERGVDGVIIAGKVTESYIEELSTFNLPIIIADFIPSKGDYPLVLIDNIKGGMLATQHLLNQGHRRIAFVGGDILHPSISERLQGYKLALEEAKIKINPQLIIIDEDYPARQNGYNAAKKLFKKDKNITAIFACNDAMAIGVMHYLKDKNIRIPEDVAVIGFDDVEADLLLDPPLSTIRVPKIEMGIEAMQLIISVINKKSKIAKKIMVPVELVVRGSSNKYVN